MNLIAIQSSYSCDLNFIKRQCADEKINNKKIRSPHFRLICLANKSFFASRKAIKFHPLLGTDRKYNLCLPSTVARYRCKLKSRREMKISCVRVANSFSSIRWHNSKALRWDSSPCPHPAIITSLNLTFDFRPKFMCCRCLVLCGFVAAVNLCQQTFQVSALLAIWL